MPAGKVFGDVSSVTTDSRNHVWVIHRPRTVMGDRSNVLPPVVEFDENGKFVNAWGGAGSGFEWPEREHGIFVDADGSVWVSGNNGFAAPARRRRPASRTTWSQVHQRGKVPGAVRPCGRERVTPTTTT
jgi:hypothetical protein